MSVDIQTVAGLLQASLDPTQNRQGELPCKPETLRFHN